MATPPVAEAAPARAARLAAETACAGADERALEAASVIAGHEIEEEAGRAKIVGNYLSAIAIFAGLAALVYYPGRIGPGAIVVALVAAGLGSTARGLSMAGLAIAGGGFVGGMIVAVALERPIF